MGKVHTVCIRCVLALHKMCVESRLFYPTISQRSCHVQHTTCSHNAAEHSMFSIQEFQAAFSSWYCTVRKYILHWKSSQSVQTVCSCIAQNMRWITGVLSNDIAAILPCTAHYLYHNAAGHSIFYIKNFQNAFSILHCTVRKCILHGKSA